MVFSVTRISIVTVGTIAIGLGSVAPVNAAALYEVTELSFLPSDINDSAQVVGENYLWEDGKVTNLNTLPGANNSNLFATSINNKGAVSGGGLTVNESTTYQETIPDQSFIYDGSKISGLPRDGICIDFCSSNTVQDINDSGTVVLTYDSYSSYIQKSDGTTTNGLSVRQNINIAINNQDQVVGTGSFTGGFIAGLFLENGQQTGLIVAGTTPDGFPFSLPRSYANDINDSGNIVGSAGIISATNSALEATLWEDVTQPGVSLGTLGGENSEALGINNLNQVVGSSLLEDDSTQHAFLWEDGELIDLNSLIAPETGWELTSAFEINERGDIIGVGIFNGVEQGFVAKAVPEPSSVLGILGLGVFGLGGWLKRKK